MDKVIIGVIRKSHGLRGHFKVASFSGEYNHFLNLEKVSIRLGTQEKEYLVEEVKPFNREILMKLKGIDTPESARLLSKGTIVVPGEMAAPLKAGEFYRTDLIGCHFYHDSKDMGEVVSIFDGAQSDLLEVKFGEGTFLVPFMKNYVGEVDTGNRKIELLAPWLME